MCSVQGQRRADHLQPLPFLVDFSHQKNIGEEQSHHLQLQCKRHDGKEQLIEGSACDCLRRKEILLVASLTLLSFLPRIFKFSSSSSLRTTPGPTPLIGHSRSKRHVSRTCCQRNHQWASSVPKTLVDSFFANK